MVVRLKLFEGDDEIELMEEKEDMGFDVNGFLLLRSVDEILEKTIFWKPDLRFFPLSTGK